MKRLLAVASTLALSCGMSSEEFNRLTAEAAVCAAGDTYVYAGLSDCRCGAPVNARRADEVNSAAEEFSCFGMGNVQCPSGPGGTFACIDGTCQVAR